MSYVKERYSPKVLGVDTAYTLTSQDVGMFICQTSGTITLVGKDASGNSVTILNAFPVTAGVVYPILLFIGVHGGTVTTAGGASGTLGV